MNDDIESISNNLNEISKIFNEVMDQKEKEQEEYWNSLSKDDQLKVFCAVVRRIYQAEIVDQGSYRHALYGVFKFGPESYAQAQLAGYLGIHNSIIPEDHDFNLLSEFCEKLNLDVSKKQISEFLVL